MNGAGRSASTALLVLFLVSGCSERSTPRTQGKLAVQDVGTHQSESQVSAVHSEEEGQGVGSIRYSQVYQLACVPDITDLANQEVEFFVESNRTHVSAGRIALFINATAGHVPLAVNARGGFRLPASAELLAEDPNIVSNQPKGSLTLECLVFQSSILLPESRAITYRKLVAPELLSSSIEGIINNDKACDFPKVLWCRLDRPDSGMIVIQDTGTKKEIPVSEEFFHIAVSSDLMAQNPLVVFPGTSRRVYFVESCGMPRPRLSGRISRF